MAKKRWPRRALGSIKRADGVVVEVKNPTIMKQLLEQQETIQAQRELLESLQGALGSMEAERDLAKRDAARSKASFDAIADCRWVSLGARLGFVRIDWAGVLAQLPPVPVAPPRNPDAIPAT